ncbi:hypothetical protein VNI00_010050 [Paramarasmius palmivorus]|uniref:DASH complex subunit SPC19 n=1 Tax=Paramarasmius palmivorus TaxID=297713 RepID=A0AAW0CIV4_9AGAR
MSRLSRPNLKGRESVFTRGPESYRGDIYAGMSSGSGRVCNVIGGLLRRGVYSFGSILVWTAYGQRFSKAQAAHTLLKSGTQDLPRITKVLESQRVFLLVDEGTVKRYKAELSEEIEPAVAELIERAEEGLKALHRKESQLQAKVDAAKAKPLRPTAGMTMAAQKLEQRRLNVLVKQREQLEHQLEAMEAEIKAMDQTA